MAQFRRNHTGGRRGQMHIVRFVMLVGVLLALVLLVVKFSAGQFHEVTIQNKPEDVLLASSTSGNIVHHTYYSLSYLEAHEQPEWVAYTLTRTQLNLPRVPRTDYFYSDHAVDTRSAEHRDYSGSGYTRGHLAPAADMAFDTTAMRESFYMSNISPQVRAFNLGIWRELEEQTRDWARKFRRLHIVTGPVLTTGIEDHIGRNHVSAPSLFYKVLLDLDGPEMKGIGFIMPNALSKRPLLDYAVSIDSVEALTGIDFFPHAPVEDIESTLDIKLWHVDRSRYRTRVNAWNHR